MKPSEYLERPYHFILVWDEASKNYTGMVQEFPGCIAQGDSLEVLANLYEAAIDWIAAAQDLGQEIPEPEDNKPWNTVRYIKI